MVPLTSPTCLIIHQKRAHDKKKWERIEGHRIGENFYPWCVRSHDDMSSNIPRDVKQEKEKKNKKIEYFARNVLTAKVTLANAKSF